MASFDHSALLPPHWKDEVKSWLRDDAPSFDIGGLVVGTAHEEASLYAKSDGVLAGVPFFDATFESLGCVVEWHLKEGTDLRPSALPSTERGRLKVATVRGPANALLLGERTALNTLSRASGVATGARAASELARARGWHGRVAGTRKTTPGFRVVEKYALLVGGAATHRLDLSQMVMLKDNHIWSAGGISGAVRVARAAAGFTSKIEVECRTHEEAIEAARAGADIVMLDNFGAEPLKAVAAKLKTEFPALVIEASGGITSATMAEFFSEHVDVISQGALTQGYDCVDFSLKVSSRAFPDAPQAGTA